LSDSVVTNLKSGIRVACPACRTVYQLRKELLGKRVSCARCDAEWRAIGPEILQAAGDAVCEVEAELIELTSGDDKTATLRPDTTLPYDYWLGKKIGRYRVDAILGTGAVGHVYRGHDDQLGRDVALKILPRPKAKQVTLRVKLFVQEARAAARLQHPNIVTIHEVGLDGQYYFFAMEVVEGGTLKDLTLALGRLSPARACFLLSQAAHALAYAHAHGVIHRDIKPDNLMMDRRGVLKVADFGLAEIGEVDIMKLYQGRPIGTPGYIAPEVARGEGASALSDIYCLGLCLYHALTGEKYLTAGTTEELVALCANPPEFRPGRELRGVPEPCVRILQRCLQSRAADRYAHAQELADELRRFVVEVCRDDSRSPLPIAGEDPFTGRLGRPRRFRLSNALGRARKFFGLGQNT
jgi:serine/threonine-protein kinase